MNACMKREGIRMGLCQKNYSAEGRQSWFKFVKLCVPHIVIWIMLYLVQHNITEILLVNQRKRTFVEKVTYSSYETYYIISTLSHSSPLSSGEIRINPFCLSFALHMNKICMLKINSSINNGDITNTSLTEGHFTLQNRHCSFAGRCQPYTHTHARARTHARTHTHINIYDVTCHVLCQPLILSCRSISWYYLWEKRHSQLDGLCTSQGQASCLECAAGGKISEKKQLHSFQKIISG
jgi:hypothetical protein